MVNDEGAGVLIVTANDDAVDDGSKNAGRAGTQRLSVLVPSKGDGKAAFQNLAGDGRPHSLIEQLIGEEEGHDGRRGCNRIITKSRLVNSPGDCRMPPRRRRRRRRRRHQLSAEAVLFYGVRLTNGASAHAQNFDGLIQVKLTCLRASPHKKVCKALIKRLFHINGKSMACWPQKTSVFRLFLCRLERTKTANDRQDGGVTAPARQQ